MDVATLPVSKMIEALGGTTKAAAAFGIDNPSVIANWRKRGQVPAERVLAAESLTGISRHELRPDIFGHAPLETERAQ